MTPVQPTLDSPIEIGGRRFANRTVLAPMVINCAGGDGSLTDAFRDFYLARAEAGVGYLVIGATYVHAAGKEFKRQLGIDDDRLTPGLADLFKALTPHCRVGIQLSFKSVGRPPETFDPAQIRCYRKAFVRAAQRARQAGADAVELHACHEYWLNYFLSPHFNRRTDDYGGNPANRFRLLAEVVDGIRAAVGRDLILGVRLSLDEFVSDGLRPVETVPFAQWLEKKGIDYISASGGIGVTQHRTSPPMDVPRGSLLFLAAELRNRLEIPVIGVGRLDRPEVYREAVARGSADLAAAARALVADPGYARKALAGDDEDIRPCIACNHCLLCLYRNEPVRCTVNPFVGRERPRPAPFQRPFKVVVAGGGPAGLSAAAHCAERGAEVTLFERARQPGGALIPGQLPPHKEVIREFGDHLVARAEQAGVNIVLGREASAETILSEAPDGVIVATGGVAVMPSIDGLDTHPKVVTAEEVLGADRIEPGRYLIVGGGAVGLETAEFLAAAGARVTVAELADTLGGGLHFTRLDPIVARLGAAGVAICTGTRLERVEGVDVFAIFDGRKQCLGAFDFLVAAVGRRSERALAEAIEGRVAVAVIGDAVWPRSICEAVREGLEAALTIELQATRFETQPPQLPPPLQAAVAEGSGPASGSVSGA